MDYWRFIMNKLGHFFLGIVGAGLMAWQAHAESPAQFKVSEFSFTRPEKWEWVSVNSPMRKAQLRVPDASGKEGAEVIFFYFGQQDGGSAQANIERWFSQFQEPRNALQTKVEESKKGEHKVTYVRAQGTYLSGMPGGPKTPKPNYMLLGAIVEGEQGNVFVRLTGPAELAKASEAGFRKMVESALK